MGVALLAAVLFTATVATQENSPSDGSAKPPVSTPAAPGPGPAATSGTPLRPGATPPPVPAVREFVPARAWAWGPTRGARGYLVRFFLDGMLVLTARAREPRFVLPSGFRFRAGRYRWSVVPILSSTSSSRYGRPVIDSGFMLSAAAAAQANQP